MSTVGFEGVEQAPVRIRPLANNPHDVRLMLRWLTDPRVLAYWDGRDSAYTEDRIREKFVARIDQHDVTPCILELERAAIGYLQFYDLEPEARQEHGYSSSEVIFGLDQFIGEPRLWSRGIGTITVTVMLTWLFTHRGADRVVLDTVVDNLGRSAATRNAVSAR